MEIFRVEGDHRLCGRLRPQGAKNEALQILSAVLLTDQPVRVGNIPLIHDVLRLIEILEFLGVGVAWHSEHECTFSPAGLVPERALQPAFVAACGRLRGSIMLVGPLLARFGQAFVPKPGGDKIGRRRLDTHLRGFIDLGAILCYDDQAEGYVVRAQALRGCYMLLDEASVTGTANIIMAASLARGTTQIFNAACEPYIQQLCRMLVAMGARIEGLGSNRLTIHGVERLGGCEHVLLPDMIEVGSFIGLAALTQSEITIEDVRYEELGIIPSAFERLGISMERRGDDLFIQGGQSYEIETFMDGSIMTISDAPWPGLTPDLLSVFLVVATQARGAILIHQKMFESRLFFVDKLIDMGAQIILCDPHRATVIGLARAVKLRATSMASPDIRAGVALLLAAMAAEGVSTISNIEQIDRGYERIDQRLNAIGARIERVAAG
ncbi:MAG: UDP-N-acetylglucosamine 1-carboxyvinyltransferase [Bacteroidia bacterium]|nr:MAG: UDP-N-acetylglucosamine 1-carboxyvinyltransferase [Bacteroidia bacterium]